MKIKMSEYKDIDSYILNFPLETQKILEKIRETIHMAAPEAKETISYGIPTFTLYGNLIHFAAYEKHIGLYPGASGIEAFKEELSGYEVSKGTVRFPINEKIPFALITKIVHFRVLQNTEKTKISRKKFNK